MPNWNAYKVFASGKRAKSPYTTFEAEESQHFFDSILPTLAAKLQKAKWIVIDSELPQERKAEAKDEEKEKFEKDKVRVLSKLAAKKFPEFADKKIEACLAMNEKTGWRWTWCVVECASHEYLGELSERFDYPSLADKWIEEQIKCMVRTQHTK
jgi:hypothetical protein